MRESWGAFQGHHWDGVWLGFKTPSGCLNSLPLSTLDLVSFIVSFEDTRPTNVTGT